MGKVLGIVYRAISTHLIHKAGLQLKDGVYVYRDNRPPRFQRIKAPDKGELKGLVHLISQRVGRCLERQGLLEQDPESAWLDLDPAEDTDAMPQILGSSVFYRIAKASGFPHTGAAAYRPARKGE